MNLKSRIAVVLLVSALSAGCSGLMQTASVSEAHKMYDRGDYAATLKLIARAEHTGEMSAEHTAALAYLKARALDGMGRVEQARTLYEYIEEQHPDSQYAYLARSQLGTTR